MYLLPRDSGRRTTLLSKIGSQAESLCRMGNAKTFRKSSLAHGLGAIFFGEQGLMSAKRISRHHSDLPAEKATNSNGVSAAL